MDVGKAILAIKQATISQFPYFCYQPDKENHAWSEP